MKRSPLKRRAKLATRRAAPRRSSRVADLDYLAAVRAMPCAAAGLSPCGGDTEADHAGKKSGMGRKADDTTCIPLCRDHHSQRHTFAGPFKSWTAPSMRAWLDSLIAATRAALTPAPSADHRRA